MITDKSVAIVDFQIRFLETCANGIQRVSELGIDLLDPVCDLLKDKKAPLVQLKIFCSQQWSKERRRFSKNFMGTCETGSELIRTCGETD